MTGVAEKRDDLKLRSKSSHLHFIPTISNTQKRYPASENMAFLAILI
jgi:hypothetical protein